MRDRKWPLVGATSSHRDSWPRRGSSPAEDTEPLVHRVSPILPGSRGRRMVAEG